MPRAAGRGTCLESRCVEREVNDVNDPFEQFVW